MVQNVLIKHNKLNQTESTYDNWCRHGFTYYAIVGTSPEDQVVTQHLSNSSFTRYSLNVFKVTVTSFKESLLVVVLTTRSSRLTSLVFHPRLAPPPEHMTQTVVKT